MLAELCCLAPPAIGDSVMTAIAIRTVGDLLQQEPPDLVVADHSILLFRQFFPTANIFSYSDVPQRKWRTLVDFRADDVSSAWLAQCAAAEKYSFDFTGERHIQIEINGVRQNSPAIPILEGDGFSDALKEAAYVMDLELLATACGTQLVDCLGAAQTSLCHWREQTSSASGHIVLAPCTSNREKMWPLAHWQQLAQHYLHQQQALAVVLGPDERDLVALFPAGVEIFFHAPWDMVCELFRRSRLVIANDCGPMHVAALFAPKLLAIFGPTDPAVWFPYQSQHKKYIKTSSATWPAVTEVLALAHNILNGESLIG